MHKKALTITGNGLLRALVSQVGICLPFLGEPTQKLQIIAFQGVWDTGASGSVITKKVADQLGLKPIGQTEVSTANGTAIKNTYLVNMLLPGDIMIQHVNVTEGDLKGIEILIGMDVICLGDFSITNKDGKTVMTFGIPSCLKHDYVPLANANNQIEQFRAQRKAKNTATKKKRKKRR